MTNWPTAPIIHVIKGSIHGSPIDGKFAVRAPHGGYGIDTHFLPQGYFGARIDEWEDVTPVPTAALKSFQAAWKGIGMYDADGAQRVTDAISAILSYLPADKPSPLDRAVTRVKEVGGPMISAETLPAERLSLLLDALASVQDATRKASPLAMVARICVDWVQADKEEVVAVEQMRSRARSMPEVIGSDPAKFLVLAGIVGEVASMLGDGHPAVSGELTNAGTYALAWAAQAIEEEDK